jgi:hypothetical protein
MQGIDIYFIVRAAAVALLVGLLVVLLAALLRHLATMVAILRSLHHEVIPLMGDLRDIGIDLKDSTEELRSSMQKVSKLGRALGDLGDDVQLGRQLLKDGMLGLRESLLPVWERFRMFRERLRAKTLAGRRP